MKLTADFHTHTTYSHGRGTVLENAQSAKQKNLIAVGITDHGFAHMSFGLSKGKIASLVKDCKKATELTGVKVLAGVETNIIGSDGKLDINEKYFDNFDILLAGIHKFVLSKPTSFISTFFPDLVLSTFKRKNAPKWLIKNNTKTFINVIKKNPIDIITHLNFCCYADAKEVAKAASDYGTYLEISSKKMHLTEKEFEDVLKTDVRFIVNSDAHDTKRIGDTALVDDIISRIDFPIDRIDNIDGRMPKFRFQAYKENR